MPFPYRNETKEMNDDARTSAGGSFIRLSDGLTHYEAGGNELGEVVVLVHGFSVPYFIYDPTFDFLTKSGFRVVRYDLFGRGFSDRPNVKYNLDFFVKQLHDLLNALRLASTSLSASTRPVNLIGLSMGGSIASAFTVRHQERVHKLVLIDPCGAKPIDSGITLKIAKIPLLAELLYGQLGSDNMVKSVANDFFDPVLVEHFQSRYKIQMGYKGFMRAILSTIRSGTLGSFMNLYMALGRLNKPVLLFWGRNDKTVPFEHSDLLRAAMPNAKFQVIEDCGHIPHYEKPDQFNPILLSFLRQT